MSDLVNDMKKILRDEAEARRTEDAYFMYGHRPDEATDNVNHPPHYKQGSVECIDAIQAALTADEFRGYCKGNALKYIWRERHKGQDESLKKAIWYLNRVVGA